MMYCNRKFIAVAALVLLTGCSSGFLGLAPLGDRDEYIQARNAYDAGNYPAAIAQLSDYIYKTKNVTRREARAYRLLGKSYEQLGQPSRALEVYSEALEFHDDNVPLLLEAGRLYQQNGLTTRSMEMYERALSEEPNNPDALAGQAVNYTTLGFYSKARSFYDQFFARSSQVAPVYRARYADTFLRQRDYSHALIHITLALEQEPANADFWRISAESRRGLQRTEEALTDLEMAILVAPKRTDLLAQKALWLYETGDTKKSLQTAEQILQLQPNNTLAQLIQALNWQKQGQTKAARNQFARLAQTISSDSLIGQVVQKLAER